VATGAVVAIGSEVANGAEVAVGAGAEALGEQAASKSKRGRRAINNGRVIRKHFLVDIFYLLIVWLISITLLSGETAVI
jgi:hypothetical protein